MWPDPHCGPFNEISERKSYPRDEVCRRHDIAYELYSNRGLNPYTTFNPADEHAIRQWRRLGDPTSNFYADVFETKRMLSQVLGLKWDDPEMLSNVYWEMKHGRNRQNLARARRSGHKKMAYGKRKRGRGYRPRRGRFKRRRRYYRRRRYRKGRFGRGKGPSRAALRYRLQDLLTPPRTIKIADSNYVNSNSTSGECMFFMGPVLHSRFDYQQIGTAVGDNSEAFMDNGVNSEVTICWASQMHRIRNNTDYPVVISAVKYRCRYDWRDTDYTPTTWGSDTNSIMQMAYQTIIAETDDDAAFAYEGADGTDLRYFARLRVPSTVNKFGINFNRIFKPTKIYKKRVLKPGESISLKLIDRRRKQYVPHIHNATGNHSPQMYSGRSQFIIFRVCGDIVGTQETDAGASEHLKVSTSAFTLQHLIQSTYTIKFFSPTTTLKDYVDNRGAITQANQLGLVDEDMALDDIEE
jgi:hypothetical protein